MNGSLLSALIVVAVVALLAWVLRAGAVRRVADSAPRDEVDRMLSEALANVGGIGTDEEEGSGEAVALTSDGWAFVPDGEEVQLVPPGDPEDVLPVRSGHNTGNLPTADPDVQVMGGRGAPVNPRTGRRVSGWKPGEHLSAGDLIAARLQRGAPDHDPWRLEALGRDHEYRAWRFETEEAARLALEMVERRVVRPPRDPDGEPVAIGPDEFAAARRIDEETEAELGSDWDEGDDPERHRSG